MGTLILDQPREQTGMDRPLLRLAEGKPVMFELHDSAMRTKKNFPNPVLCIVPMSMFGVDSGTQALFALNGYGARVLDYRALRQQDLFMIGLSAHAADLLVHEMKTVFGETHDGNHHSKKDSKRRTRRSRRKRTDS